MPYSTTVQLNTRWAFSLLLVAFVLATLLGGTPLPDRFGIGAVLVQGGNPPVIVKECIKGGPADRAGLVPGDTLVSLDEKDVRSWALKAVLEYMLIDRPLPVRVTVCRGSDHLSVQILRARISDIASGAGFRYEPNADSSNFVAVPLKELPPVRIGDVVGRLNVQDLHCRTQTLDPPRAQVTVCYFWAAWCAPCKLSMREIRDLAIDTTRTRFVGMSVDNSCDAFKLAAGSLHPRGAQYWVGGWYGDVAQKFQVHRRGIPTAVLIDRDGRLVRIATGVTDVSNLLGTLAK